MSAMSRINLYFDYQSILQFLPILMIFLSSCTALAFGKETNKVLEVWETDEHQIRLVLNEAWSGPANYRYILYKKGVFKKKIAISYSGTTLDDDDSCSISFMPPDSFNGPVIHKFDKCKTKVLQTE